MLSITYIIIRYCYCSYLTLSTSLRARSNNLQIQVTNAPLRFTQFYKNLENTVDGIVSAFMFAMAMAFIPAGLVSFTVKEREDLVKHQHLVSGVSIYSYWLANFSMDLIKHIFPAVFSFLMVEAFNIKAFTSTPDRYSAVCLLFLLFGWAIIPFTYLSGFLFKNYGASMTTTFFFNFLLGSLGSMLVFILRLIDSTRHVGLALQWVLRLFPTFSFAYGVLNIGNIVIYSTQAGRSANNPLSAYDMNVAGGDIIYLAVTGVGYFLLIFVVEFLLSNARLFR